MLRKRIIFGLLFNKGVLFRTKRFQPVNIYTHNFVDLWDVDEIVLLDISRDSHGIVEQENFYEIVEKFSRNCMVPIAVGGGVTSLNDFSKLLKIGADKVVINSQAYKNPSLITKAAEKFGAQCVVVSIDAKRGEDNHYYVCTENGTVVNSKTIKEWINEVELLGAGEIFLNSIEYDGALTGYDLNLVKLAEECSTIPLIVSGGAGTWKHFQDAFSLGVSAVCTTNIFHFTESSIRSAKQYLQKKNINIRGS